MLNTKHYTLLAGRPEKWDEEVRRQVSGAAGQNVGINLSELEEEQHNRGRRSVEVVKSAYGWTVRCASDLDNFELLAGSRCDADWPGTYAAAAAWGINWANEDLQNRQCFLRKADAEEIVTIEVEMQAFGGGRIRTVVIPVAEAVGQTIESPFWRDLTTEQKLDHIFSTGRTIFSLSRITVQSASATSSGWRAGATALTRSASLRSRNRYRPSKARDLASTWAHLRNRAECVGNWAWPIEEELKKTVVGCLRR